MSRSPAAALLALFLVILLNGFVLILAEVWVRMRLEPPSKGTALNLVESREPYAFRLNPEHPEISDQGLRDRVFAIPKPGGVERVLVLGDSVTYGLFVDAKAAYSKVLEKELLAEGHRVEVINAGMNGYTTWNELQWFRRRGALFQPDLVILQFCPNDIVDPIRHWRDEEGYFRLLSHEAFPDYERFRRETEPLVYGPKPLIRRLLQHSALYRFLSVRWELFKNRSRRYLKRQGRLWPVYVADDDSGVSLQTLENPDSVEWQWLGTRLEELKESVESSGARLVVVYVPLAYQLEEGYPLHPEKTFVDFCARRGLMCLDPLPDLKSRGGPGIFLGSHRYHSRDVWHFSAEGHRVFADVLKRYLEDGSFLEPAAKT